MVSPSTFPKKFVHNPLRVTGVCGWIPRGWTRRARTTCRCTCCWCRATRARCGRNLSSAYWTRSGRKQRRWRASGPTASFRARTGGSRSSSGGTFCWTRRTGFCPTTNWQFFVKWVHDLCLMVLWSLRFRQCCECFVIAVANF